MLPSTFAFDYSFDAMSIKKKKKKKEILHVYILHLMFMGITS